MLAHADEPHLVGSDASGDEFKVRGVREGPKGAATVNPDLWPTCTYCGSLTIDDAINALETPGTRYSGSDWTTVSSRHHTFYSTHLRDVTPEQIDRWNRVAAPLLGVEFERDERGLKWKAQRGIQADGMVGGDRQVFRGIG